MIEEPSTIGRRLIEWENFDSVAREDPAAASDLPYCVGFVEACLSSALHLSADVPLYRARIHPVGHENTDRPLPLPLVEAPPADKRIAGRVNQVDDYCLYAALDSYTALAEVRPWPMARVTIAEFELVRPLLCVDLRRTDKANLDLDVDPLHWPSFMIARPTHREDASAYLATQVLARKLSSAGVEAIIYDSRLFTSGANIALLVEGTARPLRAELKHVDQVRYTRYHLMDGASAFDDRFPPVDLSRSLHVRDEP